MTKTGNQSQQNSPFTQRNPKVSSTKRRLPTVQVQAQAQAPPITSPTPSAPMLSTCHSSCHSCIRAFNGLVLAKIRCRRSAKPRVWGTPRSDDDGSMDLIARAANRDLKLHAHLSEIFGPSLGLYFDVRLAHLQCVQRE